ncbi:MAG: 2,3,4,5-tetrahydropyridine-2,6-dicarboxylate N-acetyltransferase, partial [Alkalibacterium sp.]
MKAFDPKELIEYISQSKKTTPLKIYINTYLKRHAFPKSFKVFGSAGSYTIFADLKDW